MKLSIITVCFNEKEIERTCKSIAAQSCSDFEWLVIDGGSTDGTLEILSRYEKYITILISEPDSGIYNAMNKGIKLAKGEWLNFMNGGDEFADKEVVKDFFNLVSMRQNCDVIYANYNGILLQKKQTVEFSGNLDKYFWYQQTINHQSAFIKRDIFRRFGLYDESYRIAADWEKWVVIANNDCRFSYWNRVVANFYLDGISAKQKEKLQEEKEKIHKAHFSAAEITEFSQRALHRYKIYLFGFIPFIAVKNKNSNSVVTYKLFGILPLYRIVQKHHIKRYYLFSLIPLIKIK